MTRSVFWGAKSFPPNSARKVMQDLWLMKWLWCGSDFGWRKNRPSPARVLLDDLAAGPPLHHRFPTVRGSPALMGWRRQIMVSA